MGPASLDPLYIRSHQSDSGCEEAVVEMSPVGAGAGAGWSTWSQAGAGDHPLEQADGWVLLVLEDALHLVLQRCA